MNTGYSVTTRRFCEQSLSLFNGTSAGNIAHMRGQFGLPRITDGSSFWIEVAQPRIRLFCNPFEQLRGQRWHEVFLAGQWDVVEMLRQHGDALVHSSGRMPDDNEPCAANNPGSLFFKTNNDVLSSLI